MAACVTGEDGRIACVASPLLSRKASMLQMTQAECEDTASAVGQREKKILHSHEIELNIET